MSNHPLAEFKNEDVHVKVYPKEACKVELDVLITSPPFMREAKKKALKAVSKDVTVPGFRKGRAPEEVLMKRFGSQIEKEQDAKLADLAYVAAQKLAKVPLLNRDAKISFYVKERSPAEVRFSFTFETEPDVPSIIEGFAFEPKTPERAEVGDQQIDEAIRQMRYFYAEWKPIQDRPIQDGDTILIDLDTLDDDPPNRVFDHVRFEVSKERMADWMKELVAGAKEGDVLEGTSRPDDTASEEEKNEFNPKRVRLSILKVEEALLPELDDAFARKVGVSTVDEMRASVTKQLNQEADAKIEETQREQLNQYLVDTFPFALPESLLEAEVKHRIQSLHDSAHFQENWGKMSASEKQDFRHRLLKEANESIRLFYLSRKVVNDANIPMTHREIQDEAVAIIRSARQTHLKEIPKEIYALALSRVILAKAQNYLLAQKK